MRHDGVMLEDVDSDDEDEGTSGYKDGGYHPVRVGERATPTKHHKTVSTPRTTMNCEEWVSVSGGDGACATTGEGRRTPFTSKT